MPTANLTAHVVTSSRNKYEFFLRQSYPHLPFAGLSNEVKSILLSVL